MARLIGFFISPTGGIVILCVIAITFFFGATIRASIYEYATQQCVNEVERETNRQQRAMIAKLQRDLASEQQRAAELERTVQAVQGASSQQFEEIDRLLKEVQDARRKAGVAETACLIPDNLVDALNRPIPGAR